MEGVLLLFDMEFLQGYLENENTKLLYLLTLILAATMIDFTLGIVNAKFNKNKSFSSSKAIYGILRKIISFILLIYFIPVSLLVPAPVGESAIYVLFIGYLLSELNSILSHLKMTGDNKEGEVFADFIKTIFSKFLNK